MIANMKLIVVDDHPVLRGGLCALLLQLGEGTEVLQASDAADALKLIAQHADLDIAILDIAMPGMDGLQAIAEFGRARPELPVIVLSSSERPDDVRHALAQGALGYVPKSASQHTLLAAISLVLSGDLYIPPFVLGDAIAAPSAQARTPASAGKPLLTGRQMEVLRLLCEGHANKTIAHSLDLSEKTVKAHVTAIFKILNVISRTQAAAIARETGLI